MWIVGYRARKVRRARPDKVDQVRGVPLMVLVLHLGFSAEHPADDMSFYAACRMARALLTRRASPHAAANTSAASHHSSPPSLMPRRLSLSLSQLSLYFALCSSHNRPLSSLLLSLSLQSVTLVATRYCIYSPCLARRHW